MGKKLNSGEAVIPSDVTTKKELFQKETDIDVLIEYAQVLEQFYPDKVIQICRHSHDSASYVSENCKDFWGIPAKRMKFLTMSEYLDLIHPDDMARMSGMPRLIQEHLAEEDPSQLRFTLIYRMKSPDGHYQTVEDEKIAIKTRNGSYAYFSTYTKTTEKVTPTMDVYKMFNNKKTKIKSYLLRGSHENFSTREMDIIKLIDKGLNNAEISSHLSLSIFTVKNHKQRLFRKAQVSNTMELLRFARMQELV